jgi:hypothetical protein
MLSQVNVVGLTWTPIISRTSDESPGSSKRSVVIASLVTSTSSSKRQQKGFSSGLGELSGGISDVPLGMRNASRRVFIRLSMSPPLVTIAPGSCLRRRRMSSSATSFRRSVTKGRKTYSPTRKAKETIPVPSLTTCRCGVLGSRFSNLLSSRICGCSARRMVCLCFASPCDRSGPSYVRRNSTREFLSASGLSQAPHTTSGKHSHAALRRARIEWQEQRTFNPCFLWDTSLTRAGLLTEG